MRHIAQSPSALGMISQMQTQDLQIHETSRDSSNRQICDTNIGDPRRLGTRRNPHDSMHENKDRRLSLDKERSARRRPHESHDHRHPQTKREISPRRYRRQSLIFTRHCVIRFGENVERRFLNRRSGHLQLSRHDPRLDRRDSLRRL
jgi:hypothetical protein